MVNQLRINALFSSFSSAERKDWEKAAVSEINNNSPDEKLSWKGPENLTFLPYYDNTNVNIQSLRSFQLWPSANNANSRHSWINQPPLYVEDEEDANIKIINHLKHGADGVFLHLSEEKQFDFDRLLNSVDLSSHNLSFYFVRNSTSLSNLTDFLRDYRKRNQNQPTGNIFLNFFPGQPESLLHNFSSLENFSPAGITIGYDNNPILEIKNALLNGVNLLDHLTDNGFKAREVIGKIAFSLAAGNNFFYTIAKLKALRLLWFQIAQAYNISLYRPTDLYLHIRCEPYVEKSFNPHENMLKGTIASLAAIAGGCNALSVYPENSENEMMNRISRNVSAILKEESHMHRVADPLAGSYLLEKMIQDFAANAWKNFQKEITLK